MEASKMVSTNSMDSILGSDTKTLWKHLWFRIEPAMAFTTSKTVRFLDVQLALSFYIGVLLVVIFAVYDIIDKQSYLETAFPTGIVSLSVMENSPEGKGWPEVNYQQYQEDFYTSMSEAQKDSRLAKYEYCNNPDYWFKREDFRSESFESIRCSFKDSDLVSRVGDGSMFITTMSKGTKVTSVTLDPSQDTDCNAAVLLSKGVVCDDATYVDPFTKKEMPMQTIRKIGGVCKCQTMPVTQFTVGPANLTLTIEHSYQSEFYSRYQPKTFVYGKRDGQGGHEAKEGDWDAVFEAGNPVVLPIWKILEIAGVSLDEKNLEIVNKDSQNPYFRVSGITISMSIEYLNYKNNPDSNIAKRPIAVLKIAADSQGGFAYQSSTSILSQSVNSATGTETMEYMTIENYGISLQFTYTGMLSRFSFFSLVASIATALVLIRNVELVVRLVGINMPSSKSQTYNHVSMHRYSFHRAYARFAAQAIQAHQAFKIMDADNTGSIERHDLFECLRTVFMGAGDLDADGHTGLSLEDVKVLTEFITREADASLKGQEHLKRGDGKVSLGEWVDIVTDDSSNFKTLVKLVSEMTPERKAKLLRDFHADPDIIANYGDMTNKSMKSMEEATTTAAPNTSNPLATTSLETDEAKMSVAL
jgi:Ca2+-binding EF-hand superfamily protein